MSRVSNPPRRTSFIWLLVVVLSLVEMSSAYSQPSKPASVTIGQTFGEVGAAATDLYYGKQTGVFSKNGLNVTVTPLNTSAALVPALISGTIDIGEGSATNIAAAILKGVDLTYIGVSEDKYNVQLWANSDIKSPKDLIGKKVAVTAPGSETDQALTEFLAQYHLTGKVERVNSGDVAGMTSAFYSGAVEGAVAQPPNSFKFATRGKGYHLLADFSDVPYISSIFVTTTAYATSHPDVIARFLKAEGTVLDEIHTNPPPVTEFIQSRYGISHELAVNTYIFFDHVFVKSTAVSVPLLTSTMQDVAKQSGLQAPSDIDQYIYKPHNKGGTE